MSGARHNTQQAPSHGADSAIAAADGQHAPPARSPCGDVAQTLHQSREPAVAVPLGYEHDEPSEYAAGPDEPIAVSTVLDAAPVVPLAAPVAAGIGFTICFYAGEYGVVEVVREPDGTERLHPIRADMALALAVDLERAARRAAELNAERAKGAN